MSERGSEYERNGIFEGIVIRSPPSPPMMMMVLLRRICPLEMFLLLPRPPPDSFKTSALSHRAPWPFHLASDPWITHLLPLLLLGFASHDRGWMDERMGEQITFGGGGVIKVA